ncbi:MAG: glycosyltransferase [Actinobacteria bacterium]|nr:glycosyltransferase [Actinomycetota bacterium]
MAQRTKVMQVIARMNVGGPAVIVAELMRGLDKTQFEQILITGYCDDTEADYLDEVATDIKATRIAGLGRSVSPLADLKAFVGLVKTIREFKPDVIHTHTAKAGVLGRITSIIAGRGAVRIHTFHGHLLHGYFAGWKTQLVVSIEKFLAGKTDQLIAIGNEVKKDLIAAGIGNEEKFSVFFPGLPEPASYSKELIRRELELDPTTIYCTFVGRLTQIKRPDRLLDIAEKMAEEKVDIHFLVAGEGELFESSKRRAAAQNLPITFLGWRKDIAQLFAASDIAILTSDNEGIPLTLIQAAQAGLPILAPSVGSIADIVKNEKTGLLTPPLATPMAKALVTLFNDPALRNSMGAAGKAHAHEFFSLERMLRDHTGIYNSAHNK